MRAEVCFRFITSTCSSVSATGGRRAGEHAIDAAHAGRCSARANDRAARSDNRDDSGTRHTCGW